MNAALIHSHVVAQLSDEAVIAGHADILEGSSEFLARS